MSEHEYKYVECNGCGAEARMESTRGFGGGVDASPPGWLVVSNRDREKLWDLCPQCASAFTTWLLKRNGIEVTK